MKKLIVWTQLTFKRLLKKKGFLILLIAMPLLGWFTSFWGSNQTSGVEVGLLESRDPTASEAIEDLLQNEGLFQFILYDDEEQLINAVMTRRLETAFIFDADLTDKIRTEDHRNLIRLIRSPSTVTQGMAAEVVFSEILDSAADTIITDIVRDGGLFPQEEDGMIQEIIRRYDSYGEEGGTFNFSYEFLDGEPVVATGIPLFPVKGLLAIFLMLTAWINVLNWYKDQEDGIYNAFPAGLREVASLISVYLPVFLMTLAGFLLLLSIYPTGEALRELVNLLAYGSAISLFLYGMKAFFPSPIAYGTLLPAALLGSLVASPVILDMSSLIDSLAILEKLFLPSYYLGLSSGRQTWAVAGLILMALGGLIVILLAGLSDHQPGIRKRKKPPTGI